MLRKTKSPLCGKADAQGRGDLGVCKIMTTPRNRVHRHTPNPSRQRCIPTHGGEYLV